MFNESMWKRLKDQSGMVLPMALILLVVASIIVVPGLWATGNMIKVNQALENDTLAYYAAKSGIEDVYWAFGNNEMATRPLTGDGYKLPNQVNGMDVWVKQEKIDGKTYYISSTAKLNGNTLRSVYASMNVDHTSGYPFIYAVASTAGNIDLRSTAKILSIPVDGSADIFANGNILNSITSGYVHGEAGATGTINSCSNIQDGCHPEQLPVIFQPIDMTWYWEEARKGIAYSKPSVGWSAPAGWPDTAMPPPYTGTRTYEINNTTVNLGGTYTTYIDGNLRIRSGGKVILKGVVWVNGWIMSDSNSSFTTDPIIQGDQCYLIARSPKTDTGNGIYCIIINSNTNMNADGDLNLIADNGGVWLKGNMEDDDGNNAKMGIIYAPDSKVFVESNTNSQFGSIVGKNVELRSNIWIYYNTSLEDNPIEGFKLNAVSVDWKEFSGQ